VNAKSNIIFPEINDHIHRLIKNYLVRLYSNPENARILGRKYLQINPEKSSIKILLEDLKINGALALDMNPTMFYRNIARQKELDFIHGNVVVVDNWILARSEASACSFLTFYQRFQ
jgi:hypothetical protein